MQLIRDRQKHILEAGAVERFADRSVTTLSQLFPRLCNERGAASLYAFAGKAIERAPSYGVLSEQDTFRYLGLMLLLGVDYDTVPEPPWALALLTRASASAADNLAEIYRQVRARPTLRR